jgi:hypothetical protein
MSPVTYLQWAKCLTKYTGILKQLEKDIGRQKLLELPVSPGSMIIGILITKDL